MSSAFRGQHERSLDSKDRLTIPAKLRGRLSEGIVLLAGLDPCVQLFTERGYEDFASKFLGDINPLSKRGRMMTLRFNASATDDTLDSAGRVRIPKHLIDHAGLAGACMIAGDGDNLQIWNLDRWNSHFADVNAQAEQMAEELAAQPGVS